MGATASCLSPAAPPPSWSPPSLPARCGVLETKESTTCLFTVPHYSKWARMPVGTALNFDPLMVLGLGHFLKVYPAGFDEESADFIAVFFSVLGPFDSLHEGVPRVSFEILDEAGERAVFSNHTAWSGQTLENRGCSRGYVRFVNRRELEWSSCFCRRDDSITLRCTVSIYVEVSRLPTEVFEPDDHALSSSNCPEPAAGTIGGSYTFTIDGYSKVKAALRTGECVHSAQFSIGGSSWYLKVYPNGYCDATRDCVSVFLGRGRFDEQETTAEFRFGVIGLPGYGEGERMTRTFDYDILVHGTRCLVKSSDLALAEQMASDDDCLVVQCHLRVIKVATLPPPVIIGLEHHLKVPARSPGTLGETENEERSESAPLLSGMYYD